MTDFVHLHVHTQYSLLDGFSQIPKLIDHAQQQGMRAMGITDHGVMYGVIDFWKAANEAGIKPIIGIEAYLAPRNMGDRDPVKDRQSSHLLLLAENQTGYQNLLKIASAAQLDGYYYNPRIDRDFLAAHSEGLIVTSGCMSAEVPRALLRDNPEEARRHLSWYYETFGKDNFFIELQEHEIPELPKLNRELIDLGKHFDLNFVATNDVHYVEKSDADLQDILLCVQTSSLYNDPKRMKMSDDSYYLRSAAEMQSLFGHIPGAIENTLHIAERATVDLDSKGYVLPDFEVPEGHTVKSFLRQLCDEGLRMRFGADASNDVYQQRLDYELTIIDDMGFNAYFLIVWDLCQFAKREGIWYNARGSAAGSLVAYALEITLVDPIDHNLIFERFLNPGRVSMPDIDLDFQDDKRYLLLEYTARKYGDDMVASIITFGKMKARAAVRDVARVLDIPLNEVDRLSKLIPPMGKTIKEALDEVPDLAEEYASKEYVRNLLDNAMQIEGAIRNAGTHAAGVVVTDKPVVEYIPLHRPTSNSDDTPIKTVTQFEMQTIDALGLLKVDFLGLSTLTVMQRACDLIRERKGIDLNLYNIPLDDDATYAYLAQGQGSTAGVFQLEGGGMTRWVTEMRPQHLDHVIAMVALYRPGPMEFIPSYIRRMHGEEDIEYRHESLAPILEETYGITVYQEQIMFTAMEVGGYTASEADFLRKSVAKKKESELLENREKFVQGAYKNGVPIEAAEAIFADWEAFARYGFPKGHAADYAVIAVETAYLKCHHPVEYMTALLSVYKGSTDRIAGYIANCRDMGIEVVQPDINLSGWDFTIEDQEQDDTAQIRFGLGAIKNVGHGPVEVILEARNDGLFKDLNDLAERVDMRKVGKRALESLIMAGALDSFGPRLALLDVMDRLIAISASTFQAVESGQMTFFGKDSGLTQRITLKPVSEHVNQREMLNWERDLIGLYISDHPLNKDIPHVREQFSHFSSQLSALDHETPVTVFGQVVRIRNHITRSGKPMAFVGLEDNQGLIDMVVFPRTWEQFKEQIQIDAKLIISGNLDNERGEPKLLVNHIRNYYYADQPEGGAGRAANKERPPLRRTVRVVPDPFEAEEPMDDDAEFDEYSPVHDIADAEMNHEEAQPVSKAGDAAAPGDTPPTEAPPAARPQPAPEAAQPSPAPSYDDDMPPPPPTFEDDWERIEFGVRETPRQAYPNGHAEPAPATPEPVSALAADDGAPPASSNEPAPTAPDTAAEDRSPDPAPTRRTPSADVQPDELADEGTRAGNLPAFMARPVERPAVLPNKDRPMYMVTIVVRANHDKARDILRIRRIHGQLISYPGDDRFAIYLIENNKGIQLEFPNDTTNVNEELTAWLEGYVGKENVKVERITLQ